MSAEKPDSAGAEGRLKPFGTLRLFHYPDRLIYEPITQVCLLKFIISFFIHMSVFQSRVPLTEDMLERHTEYLASLKDPEERAEAQLEPLFSDMEAFKVRYISLCWHAMICINYLLFAGRQSRLLF